MMYPPDERIAHQGDLDSSIAHLDPHLSLSSSLFAGSSQRRPNLRSSGRVKDQRLRSKEGYDLAVFIEMDDGGGDVFLSGRVSPRLPESGGRIVFRLSLTKEQRWVARNGEWLYNGTSVVQPVQRRDGFRVEGVVSTRKPESDCCWITIGDLDGGVYCLGKWCPGGITPPLGARVSFELKKGKYGDWRVASPPGLIIISQFEVLASELQYVGLDATFFRSSTATISRKCPSPTHQQGFGQRPFDTFDHREISSVDNLNVSGGGGGAEFGFLQDDQINGWNETSPYNLNSFNRSSSQLSASFDRRINESTYDQQHFAIRQQQHEELPLHVPKQDPLFESTLRGTAILDQTRHSDPGSHKSWNDALFTRNNDIGNISHDSLNSYGSFEQQQEYQIAPDQRRQDESISHRQLQAAQRGQGWSSVLDSSTYVQPSDSMSSMPAPNQQVGKSHDGLEIGGKTTSVEPNSSSFAASSDDNGPFSSSLFNSQFLFSLKAEEEGKAYHSRGSEPVDHFADQDPEQTVLVHAVEDLALSETRSQQSAVKPFHEMAQSPESEGHIMARLGNPPSNTISRPLSLDSSGAVRRINNRMTNATLKAGIATLNHGNGRLSCRFCAISFATSDSVSLIRHFLSRHTSDAPPRTIAKARRAFQEWQVSNDVRRSLEDP